MSLAAREIIMKKLLVGLLMLGAISSYATDFYDLETGKIIYQNDLQTRIQVAQRTNQ